MESTSERLYVEEYQSSPEAYLIYLVHLATYKFCTRYTLGRKVLDYGCGSGYGTALVSRTCLRATGIDIAEQAVAYAAAHFQAPNLSYLTVAKAEDAPLPFPDASFDVVLSFQVIEHVREVDSYLQEIQRVLVPGGRVIISTPDRTTRLFWFQKPWNVWHVKEYSRDQLSQMLAAPFSNVEIFRIGGRPEVLRIELDRTRKLMWAMLPFTLPLVPDRIRTSSLRFLKNMAGKRPPHPGASFQPSFDESAIRISRDENPSIDLIAVADKRSRPERKSD